MMILIEGIFNTAPPNGNPKDGSRLVDHHMKIWWSSYGKSIVHASSNGFDDGETPLQLKAIEDAGANLQIGDDVYDDDVYDDVHEQNTIMMMMTT